jgi:hypothetical protein
MEGGGGIAGMPCLVGIPGMVGVTGKRGVTGWDMTAWEEVELAAVAGAGSGGVLLHAGNIASASKPITARKT